LFSYRQCLIQCLSLCTTCSTHHYQCWHWVSLTKMWVTGIVYVTLSCTHQVIVTCCSTSESFCAVLFMVSSHPVSSSSYHMVRIAHCSSSFHHFTENFLCIGHSFLGQFKHVGQAAMCRLPQASLFGKTKCVCQPCIYMLAIILESMQFCSTSLQYNLQFRHITLNDCVFGLYPLSGVSRTNKNYRQKIKPK
jgi:hypothetical protein